METVQVFIKTEEEDDDEDDSKQFFPEETTQICPLKSER